MATIERKSIEQPDEVRPFDKGKVEITRVGATSFSRATFEPGWRWSECVKPIVQTDSCQVHHRTFILSGRLGVRLDDGTEIEAGPGDVLDIPPGHDGWVVGDEPCISIDFDEDEYAKPPS